MYVSDNGGETGRLTHTATEEEAVKRTTLDDIDALLADTDELLSTRYPGDRAVRQPIHTVYVPGDQASPRIQQEWGQQALAAVEAGGGMVQLAERVIVASRKESGEAFGQTPPSLHQVAREAELLAEAVTRKLTSEPIEDLRFDFEDGFGDRGDEAEDAAVRAAARAAVASRGEPTAPGFVGIRFKSLEAATRARGLRTLELFVTEAIAGSGSLPEGLVLTLPKVSTPAQVQAMVLAVRALEAENGLADGSITFEVQVETPQLILGPDGTVLLPAVLDAGAGRITSLHYGTYDYSASMGVAAAYQSMEHPVADFAKNQMMLAVAGTGVHLSDGSTNILPVGEPEAIQQAWSLHARLVRRHLRRGIYQGWDMHPNQLPTRFLATFRFYREGLELAAARLRSYVHRTDSGVLDEPATAKALARYLSRGLSCGAHAPAEVEERIDLPVETLEALARTGTTQPQA